MHIALLKRWVLLGLTGVDAAVFLFWGYVNLRAWLWGAEVVFGIPIGEMQRLGTPLIFAILGLAVVAKTVAFWSVFRRHRWALWPYLLGALCQLSLWVTATSNPHYEGGFGFLVMVIEVCASALLYDAWRNHVRKPQSG
ncbi:hypothetical protein [Maricaulis parjimensis]|uniref:hypothetical protein n=1 Tax=Maricaulis parjimensis TaxID=144023 RepID=UPI001939C2A8|nr:hypothetical protein [Maricaulis parjimensis]